LRAREEEEREDRDSLFAFFLSTTLTLNSKKQPQHPRTKQLLQRRPGLAFAPPPPQGGAAKKTAPPAFPASLAELVSSGDNASRAAAASTTTTTAAAAAPFASSSSSSSSWAHDVTPTTSADLVIHPRKVAAVREWLEAQRRSLLVPQQQQKQQLPPPPPRLLVVSGPPGSGKSTTVRVLARELGFDTLEWVAPLPTLWEEHAHLNSSSVSGSGSFGGGRGNGGGARGNSSFPFSSATSAPYQSKLDAFEAFVAGCRLAPLELQSTNGGGNGGGGTGAATTAATTNAALAPQPPPPPPPTFSSSASPRPRLALVRDLPHASGADARRRLARALVALCRGSRGPVVLVATDAGGRAGAGGGSSSSSYHSSSLSGSDAAMGLDGGLHRELSDAAAAAGAAFVAFNPVTAAATARALLRAAEGAGGLALGPARAAALAGAAGGDLRSALLGAQLAVAGEQTRSSKAAAGTGNNNNGNINNNRKRSRASSKARSNNEPSSSLPAGAVEAAAALASRDAGLGAMHALGKILHNKRDWEAWAQEGAASGSCGAAVIARPLLESDPEEAVASAGLDASSSAAFLFENLPLFVQGEEALRDAANAAEYLAHADVISCSCSFARGGGGGGGNGGSNFAEAAAAAVAARGVAFSRARPAPKGWISLRGPLAGVAARAASSNAGRLRGGNGRGGGRGEEANGGGGAASSSSALLPLASLASSSREAAATLLPALRSLSLKDPRRYGPMLPEAWERLWQGKVVVERPRQSAGGGGGGGAAKAVEESSKTNDDEIENDDDEF